VSSQWPAAYGSRAGRRERTNLYEHKNHASLIHSTHSDEQRNAMMPEAVHVNSLVIYLLTKMVTFQNLGQRLNVCGVV
jgi:hypothetical protein